jgi:hypothetical protein
MAKENGLGWTTFDVDDEAGGAQDIRAATNTLEFSTPKNLLEVTGIDKSAMERLDGLWDFQSTANGTWDDATSDSPHDVFADLSGVRTWLIVVSGQTLSNEVLISDYAISRGNDGALTWSAPCALANGAVPNWTV